MNPVTRIETAINELAACLCAALEDSGQTRTCFCGVISGGAAINDFLSDCEGRDGMAYVRLVTVYPAQATGEVDTSVRNMRYGMGFDVEVGIQRTLLVDETLGTSDESQHEKMMAQEIADLKTVFQAVHCCESLMDLDVILGQWTPVGPQGFVYGGLLTLFGFVP